MFLKKQVTICIKKIKIYLIIKKLEIYWNHMIKKVNKLQAENLLNKHH